MSNNHNSTKYAILTPVRDEEEYIRFTLESVVGQAIRPAEWVIVDDGSTDRTGAILDEYAQKYPWIRVRHRPNRGFRRNGGGVMEAFFEGYHALGCQDWEFLVKLDGDLTFEPDYFPKCFEHFSQDPKLGIGGGDLYHDEGGNLKLESGPRFHVRGATKIYRRACWEAIGGLWPAPGWDTIDEARANMLGWKTQAFAELHLLHHRVTGTAGGAWTNLVKDGRAYYISGYHPLFMLARSLYRFTKKPYLLGPIGMLYGYWDSYFRRSPRVQDPALIKYIQRQQLRRLMGRESIWR
jgi:biofilm PGA synthesis N-glycosyltransferase PgaC